MLLRSTQHNPIPERERCFLARDPHAGSGKRPSACWPVEAEEQLVQIALEIRELNSIIRAVSQAFRIAEQAVDMRSDLMGSLGVLTTYTRCVYPTRASSE